MFNSVIIMYIIKDIANNDKIAPVTVCSRYLEGVNLKKSIFNILLSPSEWKKKRNETFGIGQHTGND